MKSSTLKTRRRVRRKQRVRKKVAGTAQRPRLTVFRSAKHIYAQIIDDDRGVTLCAAGTRSKTLSSSVNGGDKRAAAAAVGKALAQAALGAGVKQVAFDRNGYRYHGRIQALAQSAREAGLEF